MVEVLKPGLFSTIQDLGRFGFQEYGVPYSGVMDSYAAKVVNVLLGNEENAAVLEMSMTGPVLQFDCNTLICVSGAEMNAKLNGVTIQNNKAMQVAKGDILSFGALKIGFRGYLAVLGGFKTETVMNSRSMYSGVTEHFKLQKGDILPISELTFKNGFKNANIKVNKAYLTQSVIEVFKGPEFDLLSKTQQQQLITSIFTISKENNRMAYQLNETLKNAIKPIITAPVIPGTVQLTPSGKLIVLMRDSQTTGGYPRVLQLKNNAINVLAQKFTGQEIRFGLQG